MEDRMKKGRTCAPFSFITVESKPQPVTGSADNGFFAAAFFAADFAAALFAAGFAAAFLAAGLAAVFFAAGLAVVFFAAGLATAFLVAGFFAAGFAAGSILDFTLASAREAAEGRRGLRPRSSIGVMATDLNTLS